MSSVDSPSAPPARFTLHHRLGMGGMGEVHLATMERNGRVELVALKRMRADYLNHPEHLQQFEREASICSALAHETVVAMRAYGQDAQGPYLALEYVHGRSASALLGAFLKVNKHLGMDACLSIAHDVARGLHYAHSVSSEELGQRGLVHRDVSLDNVLVSYEGIAKLADFGIAKLQGMTSVTRTGTVKGKYGYMAPELFEGHPADTLTDVFAFAASLFRLVCGVAAFSGRSDAELMRAVLTAQAPRAASLRPEMPSAVDEWIHRALSKERSERPRDLSQIIELLGSMLGRGRTAVCEAMSEAFPEGSDEGRTQQTRAVRRHTQSRQVLQTGRSRWSWRVGVGAGGVAGVVLLGALAWRAAQGPEILDPQRAVPQAQVAPPPAPALGEASSSRPIAGAPAPAALPGAAGAEGRGPMEGVKTVQPGEATPPGEQVPAAERKGGQAQGPKPPPKKPGRQGGRTLPPKVSGAVGSGASLSARLGTLRIKVKPWAEVYIDGESRGETPLPPIQLQAGSHSLLLVNEPLGVRQSMPVQIEAGRENEVRVVLKNEPQ